MALTSNRRLMITFFLVAFMTTGCATIDYDETDTPGMESKPQTREMGKQDMQGDSDTKAGS